ncbi:endonuclease/exonuclease/phosphatase family protein [Streptomyces iranensis]|uniref:endonuclease/exonuclease/phosphatase family protein n=1 Tax=Streptomyces iranensis TaxID=576784 RepID=UPI0039B762A8
MPLADLPGSTTGPDAAVVRVLSYNIRSMRDDREALARVIRACAPDVVCVQEAPRFFRWRKAAAWLARETGLVYTTGGATAAGPMILTSLRAHVERAEDTLLPRVPGLHRRGFATAVLRFGGGHRDTGLRGTGHRDTGLRGTGDRDTGLRGTGDRDTGLRGTGDRDTGLRGTGDRDTGLRGTGLRGTGDRDTGLRGTGDRDTGLRGTGLRDTGLRDTGRPENGRPQNGRPENGDGTGVRLGVVSCHLSLAEAERYEQAGMLLDHLTALDVPYAIAAGDINDRPDGRAFRRIAGRLRDGWATEPWGSEATFSPKDPRRRIDGIFASEGIEIIGCGVPAGLPGVTDADLRLATDHLPVLAALRLPRVSPV